MTQEEKLERRREWNRRSKAKHREKRNAESRAWRRKNPEKWKECNRRSRKKHAEKVRARAKAYRDRVKSDPVVWAERSRKYAERARMRQLADPTFPERRRAYAKRTYQRAKSDPVRWAKKQAMGRRHYWRIMADPARHERHKAYDREYERARRRTDPAYAIKANLRSRLKSAVGRQRVKFRKSTLEVIGCTVPELRLYLQHQFKRGMTWKNYGTLWHIDHIIPCAKFDLTDLRQQAICFNYLNLRPCLASENIRKHARLDAPAQIPLGI